MQIIVSVDLSLYSKLWVRYYQRKYLYGKTTAWDCWRGACLNIFCPNSVTRELMEWFKSIPITDFEDKYKCE